MKEAVNTHTLIYLCVCSQPLSLLIFLTLKSKVCFGECILEGLFNGQIKWRKMLSMFGPGILFFQEMENNSFFFFPFLLLYKLKRVLIIIKLEILPSSKVQASNYFWNPSFQNSLDSHCLRKSSISKIFL